MRNSMQKIRCPKCSTEYNIGPEALKRKVKCTECQHVFLPGNSIIPPDNGVNIEKKNIDDKIITKVDYAPEEKCPNCGNIMSTTSGRQYCGKCYHGLSNAMNQRKISAINNEKKIKNDQESSLPEKTESNSELIKLGQVFLFILFIILFSTRVFGSLDKSGPDGIFMLGIALLSFFIIGVWISLLIDCLKYEEKDKTAWILIFIFLPALGAILYFILRQGRNRTIGSA